MKRILIAYFSKAGTNYADGHEIFLQEGMTEKMAKMIQKHLGTGDLFKIETVVPYSEDYETLMRQSQEEKQQNARPALREKVVGMEDYDVIFIGYPNWWGTCPMAVLSFVESYDLIGKTIFTFCTHQGHRSLYSVSDISFSAKGAVVVEGQAINANYLDSAEPTINEWLDSIKSDLE